MACFPGRRAGLICQVVLLDNSEMKVSLKANSKGVHFLDAVCSHLNLLEKDYFGLRFVDSSQVSHWLDLDKSVAKQMSRYGLSRSSFKFFFGVKFYATDPCKLKEETTRYQFFLQLKRDVLQGRITVQFELLVELCALAVQSELGDYDPAVHQDGYVSELRFAPQQSEDLEQAIADSHKKLLGYSPSSCEYMYLDKVKWLDLYGVDLNFVKGAENTEYHLGLTPSGVVIYHQKTKVSLFLWPRISGITFKNRQFCLCVRGKNNTDTAFSFTFDSREACKYVWKSCIEHHSFFRLSQSSQIQSHQGLFKLGSKFRYSGRTETELRKVETQHPPSLVKRTASQRYARRPSTSGKAVLTPNAAPPGIAAPFSDVSTAGPEHNNMADHNMADHNTSHNNLSLPATMSVADNSWMSTQGGLFTMGRDSPKSLRSEKMKFPSKSLRNDSGSEAESVHHSRRPDPEETSDVTLIWHAHARHSHRRESDNDSERSNQSRRRRRRHTRANDSGSDRESAPKRHEQRVSQQYKRSQRSHKPDSDIDNTTICTGPGSSLNIPSASDNRSLHAKVQYENVTRSDSNMTLIKATGSDSIMTSLDVSASRNQGGIRDQTVVRRNSHSRSVDRYSSGHVLKTNKQQDATYSGKTRHSQSEKKMPSSSTDLDSQVDAVGNHKSMFPVNVTLTASSQGKHTMHGPSNQHEHSNRGERDGKDPANYIWNGNVTSTYIDLASKQNGHRSKNRPIIETPSNGQCPQQTLSAVDNSSLNSVGHDLLVPEKQTTQHTRSNQQLPSHSSTQSLLISSNPQSVQTVHSHKATRLKLAVCQTSTSETNHSSYSSHGSQGDDKNNTASLQTHLFNYYNRVRNEIKYRPEQKIMYENIANLTGNHQLNAEKSVEETIPPIPVRLIRNGKADRRSANGTNGYTSMQSNLETTLPYSSPSLQVSDL